MDDAVSLASRFVATHYPGVDAAVLAGSRSRGEGSPQSDFDLVLLFPRLTHGAWREMVEFEGYHMEVFGHDLGTIRYFCRDVDRPSGRPVLPKMIVEGLVVSARSSDILNKARAVANDTLREGPPPITEGDVRARRYAITDLAVSLRGGREKHLLLAAGSALYGALADFALRASNQWSASGKAIPSSLAAADPVLSASFEAAFSALFCCNDVTLVQELVDRVLEPHGGRLRTGFRQQSPTAWRDE
jgi:predicted nucleotidyltransferase